MTPAMFVDDPPMVKQDGAYVCAVCSKPLNDVTVKNNDPFCKAEHASEWYGHEAASVGTATMLGRKGRL